MSARRLWFDDAFDGGVHSARAGAASAGESWLGPLGTLGMLESQLGLTRSPLGAGVRVGEALRGLSESSDPSWAASLSVDGLATARELLRWSDTLRLNGWNGEGGPRLAALHTALASVSPGPAERLVLVRERLRELTDVRFEVGTFVDRGWLPLRWREALEACSSVWKDMTLTPAASAAKTLVAAREGALVPDPGDAALQLVRPYGPLVAADAVAAALAATPRVPTVIIGSDPVLDSALRRHGLPTTGAPETPHDNVLGEVLPLIIELGLKPADPQRALELLTVPGGPVRMKVARRLVRALQDWPAVASPRWFENIEKVLSELEDDAARKAVKLRLAEVFDGTVANPRAYPTKVLLERAAWMQRWLHGRLANESSPEGELRLLAAIGQVALFANLVDRAAVDTLTMTQVRRFLEEAHRGMPTPPVYERQAGLVRVAQPGGVVAPVERIVWWNYTRSASPAPRSLGLSGEELRVLAEAGVVLPTPSEVALQRAARARRPFQMATESLWLVCPRHEINGDAATPHSSWDEVAARVKDSRLVERLVRAEPLLETPVVRKKRPFLPLPAPLLEWDGGVAIPHREEESPSSVEMLLGCSLQWALNYVGKLRSGATATLASGDRLLGSLAHHVLLERLLRTTHASADAAAEYAIRVLNDEGPSLAAPLFVPGASAERGQAEQVFREAARALHGLVAAGWSVVGTEAGLKGKAFGTGFGGILDLIVERNGRRAVVDLKWSALSYRRASLEEGTAIQLAAYHELLRQNGFADAPVAYFIVTTRTLLSADPSLAAGGTTLASPWLPGQTWQLVESMQREAWKSVSQGRLRSPGVVDEAHFPETKISENAAELSVQPQCRFCELGGVCGRRYGRIEVVDEED